MPCCDEHIRTFARDSIDISWNGENIASMFESELGGDERSTREGRLRDQSAIRYSRDDLIPDREVVDFWSCSEWKMRDDSSTMCDDLLEERLITGGITSIYPGSEYGNRITIMIECDMMSNTVDSCGSTTHNSYPSAYRIGYDFFENSFGIWATLPRSDNAYQRTISPKMASHIEEERCMLYRLEAIWIVSIEPCDDLYFFAIEQCSYLFLFYFLHFFDDFRESIIGNIDISPSSKKGLPEIHRIEYIHCGKYSLEVLVCASC